MAIYLLTYLPMMRTAFLTAFCLILFYPALTAQSLHYYYAPNTLQIPVLREKGDAIIGAGLARTGSYTDRKSVV